MVKIRFSSALRGITKTNEKIIELDNIATLKLILDRSVEEFGDDFEHRIIDKGEIRRFINIYINGEDKVENYDYKKPNNLSMRVMQDTENDRR